MTLNSAADGPGNAGGVVDVNTVDQGDYFLRGLFIFDVVLCRCVYGLVVYLKSSKGLEKIGKYLAKIGKVLI